MISKSIEERKRYVEQIRASFGSETSPRENHEMDQIAGDNSLSFFKIKAFVAFILFLAFVYCDQNDIEFKKIKTNTVIEKMQETIPVDNVIQSLENMI